MDEHEVTWVRGGSGPMGWIMPRCSCGWTGAKAYNYDDEQYANLEEQEFDHKREG